MNKPPNEKDLHDAELKARKAQDFDTLDLCREIRRVRAVAKEILPQIELTTGLTDRPHEDPIWRALVDIAALPNRADPNLQRKGPFRG